MLQHKFTNSSFLEKVAYDNGILTVTFKSGKDFRYVCPDAKIYHDFVASPSAGSYYSKSVKGVFQNADIDTNPLPAPSRVEPGSMDALDLDLENLPY